MSVNLNVLGKTLVNLFGIHPCTCQKFACSFAASTCLIYVNLSSQFFLFCRFLNWMSFSSDIVCKYTGKQGGFLASFEYLKMLHSRSSRGFTHWTPPVFSMPWTCWGASLTPTFGMIKHNLKIPLELPEGNKSLQANLRLERFV